MKVVILAGGLGTRLSEETQVKPKPMVEIGEQPILWHIMKIYGEQGITEFVICLGYKGYVIKEYFANYFLHNSDVTFDLRGTGHGGPPEHGRAVAGDAGGHRRGDADRRPPQARRAVRRPTSRSCMTYGDGVADIDIDGSARLPRGAGPAGHGHRRAAARAASAPCDSTRTATCVQDFVEKPEGDGGWINGGFFVLEPAAARLHRRRRDAVGARAAGGAGARRPAGRLPAQRLLAADGHAARQAHSRGAVGERRRAVEALVMFGGDIRRPARLRHRPHRVQGVVAELLARCELGADVTGYALEPPTEPSLFDALGLAGLVRRPRRRRRARRRARSSDESARSATGDRVPPGRAAASCARATSEPRATFDTNVMGTVNLLEAVRALRLRRGAVVVVTSDKCYRNRETAARSARTTRWAAATRTAPARAAPSSSRRPTRRASSAPARAALATARAGNVIGGGDWAPDRIVPDCVRALAAGRPIEVRNPDAVRPWQHVLEPLAGYLLLGARSGGRRARLRGRVELRPCRRGGRADRALGGRAVHRGVGLRRSGSTPAAGVPSHTKRMR